MDFLCTLTLENQALAPVLFFFVLLCCSLCRWLLRWFVLVVLVTTVASLIFDKSVSVACAEPSEAARDQHVAARRHRLPDQQADRSASEQTRSAMSRRQQ
jgi:hypothetical protein